MHQHPELGNREQHTAKMVADHLRSLGMVKPGTTSGGHHTPTFAADNACVPVGMRAMSMILLDYLAMQ